MITKAEIIEMLRTNDKAVGRALLAIHARQTADERVQETTKYHNQRGFRPGDAKKGSGMATFFNKTGFLTPKQLAYWRHTNDKGRMRIEIYASQLLIVAQEKAATKITN
jgi:hypothetical protein